MTTPSYDVIVIGAGPGGYVAALRASQLGLKTAIVEREHLGGICLNWGCIPTKALLHIAEVHRNMSNAAALGLKINGDVTIETNGIVERSRRVSSQLNKGVGFLLNKNGVDLIWGDAKLIAPGHIEVAEPTKAAVDPQPAVPKTQHGPGTYKANHIIIATGARPKLLPGLEPDGDRVWTYFEAMKPAEIPKSMIIVGAGAIGIEFASFYQTMGCKVTVIEAEAEILPNEDQEVAGIARRAFESHGIEILTNAFLNSVAKTDTSVTVEVELQNGEQTNLSAERLISAIGVLGNIEDLGLEELGVKTQNHTIAINHLCATNVDGIYAIGDVAGGPMLAHKAEHEGVLCVEAIAGSNVQPIEKTKIPSCTYSHPQIASVGLTEEAARRQVSEMKVGKFPFRGNGKAIALGEPEGMVKTIFDAESGQLIGAHLIGPDVTELIQGFVIGMQLETTEDELIHAIFPHPTLSEAMHESVLDAFGRAIHK